MIFPLLTLVCMAMVTANVISILNKFTILSLSACIFCSMCTGWVIALWCVTFIERKIK